jgi:hypothetical protein
MKATVVVLRSPCSQILMTPYASMFSLFSDWGGFLSIFVVRCAFLVALLCVKDGGGVEALEMLD